MKKNLFLINLNKTFSVFLLASAAFFLQALPFTLSGCKSAEVKTDVTAPYGKSGSNTGTEQNQTDEQTNKTAVISTKNGLVRGIKNPDNSVELFAGIPYAKPPVGALRWREPEAAENWDGIYEADHFAPMAVQKQSSKTFTALYNWYIKSSGDRTDFAPMSEDCLYLNIWRPADYDYTNPQKEKLPVLVYIHGGSLTGGSSWFESYDGEALSKKGIIFVSIAYRVGIFGFLTSDELAAESPNHSTGNYGLLDQIKALEWINQNIQAFGGDSTNITIAGESAGSSSVCALCVSPLSKGLFRRAIGESSSLCVPVPAHTFRTRENALNSCREIMEEFGVSSVKELREFSAEQLMTTPYSNNAFTVDEYSMPDFPWELYAQGKNHEEALLNGFNANEGGAFLFFTKVNKKNVRSLVQESPYVTDVDGICSLYDLKTNKAAKQLYADLFSSVCFTYPHYSWTKVVSAQNKPVYEYCFSRQNPGISTMHSGELVYAYGNLSKNKKKIYKPYDYELSQMMQNYWVNFVKYGDPNGNPASDAYKKALPVWEKAYEQAASLTPTASTTSVADSCKTPESYNTVPRLLELGDQIKMTSDPFLNFYNFLNFDIERDKRPVTFGKERD